MWRRFALSAPVLAALALPAGAQEPDPLAKIFDQVKARWLLADKAAETADARALAACDASHAPRMSFQPMTTYIDVTAAVADGAAPVAEAGDVTRSGSHVLRLTRKDGMSVLSLEDENARPVVSRRIADSCAPLSIAATPDGFLVRVPNNRVLWLDGDDLHARAIYRLTMPARLSPAGITLLPNNRLVATTGAAPPAQGPVLVYNLSAPMPQ